MVSRDILSIETLKRRRRSVHVDSSLRLKGNKTKVKENNNKKLSEYITDGGGGGGLVFVASTSGGNDDRRNAHNNNSVIFARFPIFSHLSTTHTVAIIRH